VTGKERPGVFASAVDRLNLLQPEFVMSVGDLIISEEQVAYMTQALKDNDDVRWTLVFMHQPVYGEIHFPKKNLRLPPSEVWLELEKELIKRPYTVFAGHVHKYLKTTRHGRSYLQLATTGGGSAMSGLKEGGFDHIVWVTMTDDGPVIANLLLDGIHDENVSSDLGSGPG
jgi:hypothetical protein